MLSFKKPDYMYQRRRIKGKNVNYGLAEILSNLKKIVNMVFLKSMCKSTTKNTLTSFEQQRLNRKK